MLLGMHDAEAVHRNQVFADWSEKFRHSDYHYDTQRWYQHHWHYMPCTARPVHVWSIAIAGDVKGLHHTLSVKECNVKTTQCQPLLLRPGCALFPGQAVARWVREYPALRWEAALGAFVLHCILHLWHFCAVLGTERKGDWYCAFRF